MADASNTNCTEASGRPAELRIVHLSDTHGHHDAIARVPDADLLVHTGDFTNHGSAAEIEAFDRWLATAAGHIPREHRLIILGNHDWRARRDPVTDRPTAKEALNPAAISALLQHGVVLEHSAVTVHGLTVYGSGWCPWHDSAAPGDRSAYGSGPSWRRHLAAVAGDRHRFDEIPAGVDVLLTHGAPLGVLDRLEDTEQSWGGSAALRTAVERARPGLHCFGHIHEQRGVWARAADGSWTGTVDYTAVPGEPWRTFDAPPSAYPGQLISNGALANHPGLDGRESCLAGAPRVIVATRTTQGSAPWLFRVALV